MRQTAPGTKGNLIVTATLARPAAAKGKAVAAARQSVATLPAIPFEIVRERNVETRGSAAGKGDSPPEEMARAVSVARVMPSVNPPIFVSRRPALW
jgi:hypothetical protein